MDFSTETRTTPLTGTQSHGETAIQQGSERGVAHPWRVFAIGAALVLGAFALLTLPAATVDTLVKEDGPIEWVGAVGLFAGSFLFFSAFFVARRRGAATGLTRIGIVVLALMGIGLFFAGGEEISWGQRLLGFGDPAGFSAVNAQDETNLHNLNVFQGTLIDGDRLFKFGYLTLFVLLPALTWISARARRRLDGLVPIAPPWLALLFLLAWVAADVANNTLSGAYSSIYPLSHSVSEVQESCVEVMAGIMGYLALRRARGASKPS
ncbi:MAG: hypothetical protein WBC33_01540 [Conexibacter sp.]